MSDPRGDAVADTVVFSNHLVPAPGVVFPEKLGDLVSTDLTPTTVRLEYTQAGFDLEPGAILWGVGSGGYVRRIARVSRTGSTFTLDTTDASIDEAIVGGFYGVSDLPLTFTSATCVANCPPEAAIRLGADPSDRTRLDQSVTLTFGTIKLPANSPVALTLTALQFELRLRASLELDWPSSFRMSIRPSVNAQTVATMLGGVTFSHQLGTYELGILPLGWFKFVVTLEPEVVGEITLGGVVERVLGFHADETAAFSVTPAGVSSSLAGAIEGTVQTTAGADITVDAEVGLQVPLKFKLMGGPGPYVAIKGVAGGASDVLTRCLDTFVEVSGQLGADFKVGNLIDVNIAEINRTLWHRPIGHECFGPPANTCATDAACAPTMYCSGGACVQDVCAQGARFCRGAEQRSCNANGSGSSLLQTCAFGCAAGACQAQCVNDGGCAPVEFCSAGTCVPDVCAQGQPFCTGVERRQCSLDGSTSTLVEQCAFGCLAGACQPQCANDGGCPAAQHCAAGACVVDACAQGAYFCSGADRRLCDGNGAASTLIETCAAGCSNGTCTASGPATLAMNLSNPWQLTLDASYVYWVENVTGGSVRRVAKAGGAVQTLATGLAEPPAVAVDATYAYVLERNGGANGRIQRFPIAGGPGELVVGGLSNAQNVLAQDASYLYFSDQSFALGGLIKRVRKEANATATILVQGNGLANVNPPIAVDATSIYFRNDLGRLFKAPLIGGAPADLGLVPVNGVTVAGGTLYFAAGGTNVGQGWIGSLPITGGVPATLVTGRSGPTTVAFDGSYLYWIELEYPGGVFRVNPAGGGFKTYSTTADAMGVAVDADFVYWTDPAGLNDGRIMRAPK